MKNTVMATLIAAVVSLLVIGCSQQSNLVDPQQPPAVQQKSEALRAAEAQGLHLIYLPERTASLARTWVVKKTIPYAEGGSLDINETYTDRDGNTVIITCSLVVPKNALDSDEQYSMKVQDGALITDLDFTFRPHANFKTPVLLTTKITGVDCTGWTSSTDLFLYYYNTDTREWEQLDGKGKLDVKGRKFNCDKVKLPHFSQYAFGRAK